MYIGWFMVRRSVAQGTCILDSYVDRFFSLFWYVIRSDIYVRIGFGKRYTYWRWLLGYLG